MSDYTPSLAEARDRYSTPWHEPADYDYAKEGAEFDRMIEAVRAEERQRALVEGFRAGVTFIDDYESPDWGGAVVAGRNEASRRENEWEARIREQGKEQDRG